MTKSNTYEADYINLNTLSLDAFIRITKIDELSAEHAEIIRRTMGWDSIITA